RSEAGGSPRLPCHRHPSIRHPQGRKAFIHGRSATHHTASPQPDADEPYPGDGKPSHADAKAPVERTVPRCIVTLRLIHGWRTDGKFERLVFSSQRGGTVSRRRQ